MRRSSFSVFARALWFGFSRLKTIPYTDPVLISANWCEAQPCLKIKIAAAGVTADAGVDIDSNSQYHQLDLAIQLLF